MAYKGLDQELWVPTGSGPGAVGLFDIEQAPHGVFGPHIEALSAGAPPLWVDDAVHRLCQEAAELAARHGGDDVGLVHFVHAMTANETSLLALYELNIHVSSLKRETAAIIAQDDPRLRSGRTGTLPKSEELQDVLIQAADLAYARQSPVTTADIIDTLFDMSRDTTRKILHRHRPDFDLRDTTPPPSDERTVRVSTGSQHLGGLPDVPSVTDTLQNTRMDAIERAIRDLTEDMARNRATFSSLMEELRDSNNNNIPDVFEKPNGHAGSWGDDDAHALSVLIGRVENSVEAKFKELGRAWSVLGDRLKALEDVVEDLDEDHATPFEVTQELDGRLKTLSVALDRLDKFEDLLTTLPNRLAELERRLQTIAPSDFDVERLTAKVESIEQLIQSSDGAVELGPVMSGLRDVEAGLRGVGGQLREVDTRTGDGNLMLEGVSERQQRVEDQISDILRIVRDDFDLTGLSSSDEDREEAVAAIGAVVADRFAGLSMQLQQRMGHMEEVVRSALDRPIITNGGDLEGGFVSEALAKIVNNQHTLAESMDEWRVQARDDVAALGARMDRFENRPVDSVAYDERFTLINDELKTIRSLLPTAPQPPVQVVPPVAQQDGWTRFKMWLFGTNDWYAESWGGAREDDDRVWQPGQGGATGEDRPAQPAPHQADTNGYDHQRA